MGRVIVIGLLLLSLVFAKDDAVVIHFTDSSGVSRVYVFRSDEIDSLKFIDSSNTTQIERFLVTRVGRAFELFSINQRVWEAENSKFANNLDTLGLSDNRYFTQNRYFAFSVIDSGVIEASLKESWGDIPKGSIVGLKLKLDGADIIDEYYGKDGFESSIVTEVLKK